MAKLIFILSCLGVLFLVAWETFPNTFGKTRSWLRSLRKLKSVEEAKNLELSFEFNAYGDQIRLFNMRSGWIDKYGIHYKCDEIYIDETDALPIELSSYSDVNLLTNDNLISESK